MKNAAQQIIKASTSKAVIEMAKHWLNKPPINFENHREVKKRLDEYFDYMENANMVPSYEGMAMALHVGIDVMNRIEQRAIYGIQTSRVITAYKNILAQLEYYMTLDNVMVPSLYELRSSYFSGINKKTTIDIAPQDLEREKSIDEIRAQIAKENAIDILDD